MVSRKYGSSPSTEHGNEHAWIVKHSLFSTVGSTQEYPVSSQHSAVSVQQLVVNTPNSYLAIGRYSGEDRASSVERRVTGK